MHLIRPSSLRSRGQHRNCRRPYHCDQCLRQARGRQLLWQIDFSQGCKMLRGRNEWARVDRQQLKAAVMTLHCCMDLRTPRHSFRFRVLSVQRPSPAQQARACFQPSRRTISSLTAFFWSVWHLTRLILLCTPIFSTSHLSLPANAPTFGSIATLTPIIWSQEFSYRASDRVRGMISPYTARRQRQS